MTFISLQLSKVSLMTGVPGASLQQIETIQMESPWSFCLVQATVGNDVCFYVGPDRESGLMESPFGWV